MSSGSETPDGAKQPLARTPRIGLRVSGARVGDAVRPLPSTKDAVGPRLPRFGLRVNNSRVVSTPAISPVDRDASNKPLLRALRVSASQCSSSDVVHGDVDASDEADR